MTFQFSSALQWWFTNWIFCARVRRHTCTDIHLCMWHVFPNTVGRERERGWLCSAFGLVMFGIAACVLLIIDFRQLWTIMRLKKRPFVLLINWYETWLSAGCQGLWTHEARPGAWFISTHRLPHPLGARTGGGGEDAIHITWLTTSSKQRWTLTRCRRQWSNRASPRPRFTHQVWSTDVFFFFFEVTAT